MAHVWMAWAEGTDANGRISKQDLITPHAFGTVLDIGAGLCFLLLAGVKLILTSESCIGHGHTVNYLDRERVQKYIALEPNTLMHPHIRQRANASGFIESEGTLTILTCGAEDTSAILSQLGEEKPSVDTMISVLAMCSVPDPERSMARLFRDILKPGGQVLFYEHVLSPRQDIAWWQRFWTPIWTVAFDGCKLDRPTHLWIGKYIFLCSAESCR